LSKDDVGVILVGVLDGCTDADCVNVGKVEGRFEGDEEGSNVGNIWIEEGSLDGVDVLFLREEEK